MTKHGSTKNVLTTNLLALKLTRTKNNENVYFVPILLNFIVKNDKITCCESTQDPI
jgi:hypothetical protein